MAYRALVTLTDINDIGISIVGKGFFYCFFFTVELTVKTFIFTRQWIYIPPESDEKRPTLCYALPIALGTLIYIYLKATGSTLIQDLLGFRFSL